VLLNKEFDADDSEVTRTRKIRRRFVAEKYAALVDALYGGADTVALSAAITYEDGRTGTLTATLAIETVEAAAEPAREPIYA
jgi:long-chain acyl-CoA synthetase